MDRYLWPECEFCSLARNLSFPCAVPLPTRKYAMGASKWKEDYDNMQSIGWSHFEDIGGRRWSGSLEKSGNNFFPISLQPNTHSMTENIFPTFYDIVRQKRTFCLLFQVWNELREKKKLNHLLQRIISTFELTDPQKFSLRNIWDSKQFRGNLYV